MARELGCDRKHLLKLRHRLQGHARQGMDRNPLDDDGGGVRELHRDTQEEPWTHERNFLRRFTV